MQLYHAWARLEGKLGNWAALNDLNKRATAAFPSPGMADTATSVYVPGGASDAAEAADAAEA